ncbi:MAG: hypothetical protein WED07_01910 [Candidatus Freyarchaeum deiterrae]
MVALNVYDLLFLMAFALSLACMIYLARHYVRNRNSITLLLTVFFAMFSLTYIGYLLITTGIIQFDLVTYLLYVSLVDFGVILLIGLAMIKLREAYLLPASIILIGYFHESILSSSRDLLVRIIQFFSYYNYGQLIGNPLYMILSDQFFGLFPIQYAEIFDMLFKPLFEPTSFTPADINIIGIYLLIISAPTIILFYYLAWKNRSGRSLGFALGITVLNFNLITGVVVEIMTITSLVSMVFIALGIFGIFDRIAKTGSRETQAVAAKNKST